MITKQAIAEKIYNYLTHKISLDALVDWAENAIMNDTFKNNKERDIVARLGVADVKYFGLQWNDCETYLNNLGYKVKVEISKVA